MAVQGNFESNWEKTCLQHALKCASASGHNVVPPFEQKCHKQKLQVHSNFIYGGINSINTQLKNENKIYETIKYDEKRNGGNETISGGNGTINT